MQEEEGVTPVCTCKRVVSVCWTEKKLVSVEKRRDLGSDGLALPLPGEEKAVTGP